MKGAGTMSEEKKPLAKGKGVQKKGKATGTGPVNNMGNYEDRKEQQAQQQTPPAAPAGRESTPVRPSGQSMPQQQGQNPFNQSNRPQNPFPFGQTGGQHRPQSNGQQGQFPFGQSRPQQNQTSFGQHSRPQSSTQQERPSYGQNRPQNTGSGRTQGSFSQQQGQRDHSQTTRTSGSQGSGMGGNGVKIILAILVAVVLYFVGKNYIFNEGNSGNNNDQDLQTGNYQQTQNTGNNGGNSPVDLTGGNGQGSGGLSDLFGGMTQYGGTTDSNNMMDLLSSLLGSGTSSIYDTSISEASSAASAEQYFTSSMDDNDTEVDEEPVTGIRNRYTTIRGNGRDTVTIMVYMCGADLESQSGMGTSDLKEMTNATLSDKVNLIVFTGGCRRWQNNVISTCNQIYQIKDGKLYRLEENLGNASMTDPATLSNFIRYGKKNFDADRMCLIFWDHGGGSISGYGYDERYGKGQTMKLAGINTALENGKTTFDFIGFDTCLMATVENAIMLGQYADYMIASEETEPGVGWYYTNWLTKLSKNTSMPTTSIGKIIVDDFVEVCNQKCRGQATTLSVVDLAELQHTIPDELKNFSIDTNELIQNNEYKKVSSARSKTREFAQSSRIDQIDLVHFAKNLGTAEGTSLAAALQKAIKYNRTGGGISNAYGLSIYFPYQRTNQVNKIVSTYKAIGMDDAYTKCIQEFASLEVSGQVSAGTPIQGYGIPSSSSMPGLMDSLLGNANYYSDSSYSSDGLESLLGGLFSSGNSGGTGSILDLFMGRSMTAEKAASYILENHFDPSFLVWQDGRITLPDEQWEQIESVRQNVFFDDGEGFIDLGTLGGNKVKRDGNSLVHEFDGGWISLDEQPVSYYYLGTVTDGDNYCDTGYVPVLLNGVRADLILNFDSEHPDGYVAGVQLVYEEEEAAKGKTVIRIQEGDEIQPLCDYFDYNQNYQATYKLGDPFKVGSELKISRTLVDEDGTSCKVTYCFTDYYQQRYWAPSL